MLSWDWGPSAALVNQDSVRSQSWTILALSGFNFSVLKVKAAVKTILNPYRLDTKRAGNTPNTGRQRISVQIPSIRQDHVQLHNQPFKGHVGIFTPIMQKERKKKKEPTS